MPTKETAAAKKHVLVVEDDRVNAKVLSDFLGAHGFSTTVAVTGAEGVERFRAERPDLMLIDVLLPNKSGFEVCFDVKRSPEGKNTPVLLMSAIYQDVHHAEQYARLGLRADGFLTKPFELNVLLQRIRHLLGEA